jgi:sulfur carrier protein ThiS adenylyltransferase
VGIAGAGGLGSNAAIALARSGVINFVIVDFDTIEQSNLNRQYYFLSQIGQKKVRALENNIKNINPEVSCILLQEKLMTGSMWKPFTDVDIIIEALDHAETKTQFIEEVLTHLPNIPIVAASGVAGYGQSDRIRTIKTGNLHMVYDEEALSSDEDVLLAPKVCLMANWQANIALELLLGESI